MSSGKASTVRKWLDKNGYIEKAKDSKSGRIGWQIVRFWSSPDEQTQQNSSPDEQNVHEVNGNVHDMNADVHEVNLSNTTIRQTTLSNKKNIYDPMLEIIQPIRTALNAIIKRQADKPEYDAAAFIEASEILYGRDATPEQVKLFGDWWKGNGWHNDPPVLKNVVNNWADFLAGRDLKKKPSANGHQPHKETGAERYARLFGGEEDIIRR